MIDGKLAAARMVAALAVAIAALALAASGARARPVIIVGNLRDGTVTVVDEHALKVLGAINVTPDGKTPQDPAQALVYPALVQSKGVNYVQGLALSPNGRTLYVSRGYLGDVAAFDVASRRLLWRLEVSGVRADHLALSPDGRRLFVSALTSNEVQVIDTATHSFVGSFATGDWAHVLEFTPDGRFIVNGSLGNQLLPGGAPTNYWLTFANPQTLQVQRVLKFGAGVRPFIFSPDGSLAYVQFSFFNGFKVIDTSTGQALHSVNLPVRGPAVGESASQYPNQAAHHGLALSGDHRTICDAATVSNYVALVGRKSLRTRAIIRAGDQPADAETSTDGRLCLVTNRGTGPGGDTLSVISYRLRRQVKRLRMGQGPQELIVGNVRDAVLRRAGFTLAPAHRPSRRKPRHRTAARR
jgi:DNA-binding beta-propeller fold protein YncE